MFINPQTTRYLLPQSVTYALRKYSIGSDSNIRQLTTIQRQQCDPRQSPFDMSKCYTYTPHSGYVRTSPYELLTVPNQTIDQYVWKDLNRWHHRIAMVCGVTGRQYTYAQLRDHCAALAVRLQTEFHLKCNDVIGICLPNLPEFPIATLGAIEAGLVVTTINPVYTADEMARQLIDSNAKCVIGTISGYPILKEAVRLTQKPLKIVCIRTEDGEAMPNDAIDFNQLIDVNHIDFSRLTKYDIDPNSMAILPYSSGTTGLSKGVKLSHKNICVNCVQVNVKVPYEPIIRETTDTYQDVIPAVLPMFHIYGFTVLMASKIAGGVKVITLPKFHPETFMKSIVHYKGTVLNLAPPLVLFLADHPMVKKEHLVNVRTVVSGAAPIGALDAERLTEKAPHCEFIQAYGLTETSPGVFVNIKQTPRTGSIGAPISLTEAKICRVGDETFKGIGPNEPGELLVRGPQVMLGYHNNQQATDETIIGDGWLRTGDLGHYDDDGYFYITDRLKELIKVKGFQVPPAELEELLRAHPKVLDAAVVGQSHPIKGEVPRAFVVKRAGVEVTEDELKEFVASKVANFKRLDGGVHFLEAIPKNAAGKILRREIKEKYCN